jgi:hypothetical protein
MSHLSDSLCSQSRTFPNLLFGSCALTRTVNNIKWLTHISWKQYSLGIQIVGFISGSLRVIQLHPRYKVNNISYLCVLFHSSLLLLTFWYINHKQIKGNNCIHVTTHLFLVSHSEIFFKKIIKTYNQQNDLDESSTYTYVQ